MLGLQEGDHSGWRLRGEWVRSSEPRDTPIGNRGEEEEEAQEEEAEEEVEEGVEEEEERRGAAAGPSLTQRAREGRRLPEPAARLIIQEGHALRIHTQLDF